MSIVLGARVLPVIALVASRIRPVSEVLNGVLLVRDTNNVECIVLLVVVHIQYTSLTTWQYGAYAHAQLAPGR